MSCPEGQHRYPQGTLVCSVCGAKASALARGEALPYAAWTLARSAPVAERARSLTFAVTDTSAGATWHIREFFPGFGRSSDEQKRRFVNAAKSLRDSPVQTMRTHFPYTSGGLCYVVSQPVAGASLEVVTRAQKISESDAALCLGSLLRALVAVHGTTGTEGPLFLGGFRLSDVIVSGNSLAGPFEINNSLYLENILAESPLTFEQASGLDVQAAGEVALELAAGKVPAAKQQVAVSQMRDNAFGAALEYILHPANGQRPSAKQALLHLELLRKAQASGVAADWKAAFDLSGAARLAAAAAPRPTPPPPAAGQPPPPPPPAPAVPAQAVPVPPPFANVNPPADWKAVAGSEPPPFQHMPPRSGRRFVVRGCLLSILIGCGLLVALLVYSCSPEPQPEAPTIEFGVGPNPAARGQQVTLTWGTTGYASVSINDAPKPLRGSETFTARKKTTYVLVATGKDHHQDRREVTLLVQNAKVVDAPLPAPKATLPENNAAPIARPIQHEPAPEPAKSDVTEAKPLSPPQPAPATSGILRYSGPPVQFGESISFSRLPSAMLRISFDRANWQPQFSRQSDGTQTLTLRSRSHDPQSQCVVVWQITQ